MQQKRILELWVGFFVLLGLLALGMLAFRVGNLATANLGDVYTVTAEFGNVGGLKTKAPVTLAGVRIGRVSEIRVDRDNFRAQVVMTVSSAYDNLPADSTARILTSGILGEQYVGVEPGGEETVLKDGDQILLTQSALVLENLVGQVLYKMTGGDN
jgi:phospholipid/cholesterol/gamma-HCH transport system substrate-binding protein